MRCSGNQIEQTARKAARGAGLPWGLADEAGKAVRWLHSHHLNGGNALVQILHQQTQNDYAHYAKAHAPSQLHQRWRAPSGVLDPLLVATALSDCLPSNPQTDPNPDLKIQTEAIAHPLLTLGYIGNLAQTENLSATIHWHGVHAHYRHQYKHQHGILRLAAQPAALNQARANSLHCHITKPTTSKNAEPTQNTENNKNTDPTQPPTEIKPDPEAPLEIPDPIWRALEKYAHRTYVPATEAARLTGAGAGLHDND